MTQRQPFEQRWRKLGRVLPRGATSGWDERPSGPCLVRSADRYLMYLHFEEFHDHRNKLRRIGLAAAPLDDPMTWSYVGEQPLLDLDPPGPLDSHMLTYPWIVPIDASHWHMYYAAWDGSFLPKAPEQKRYITCLAESDDGGISWSRVDRELLQLGRPDAVDHHGSGSCAVIPVGDELWMYYTALLIPNPQWHRIFTALAVSRDGGHTFTPHPAGALVNVPPRIGGWGSTASKPFVRWVGDRYDMWFSCAEDGIHYRIHYARSADGVHFEWHPLPVVDVSDTGWDSEMTCYPFVIEHEGRTLMFYAGNDYAGIGVAELAQPG